MSGRTLGLTVVAAMLWLVPGPVVAQNAPSAPPSEVAPPSAAEAPAESAAPTPIEPPAPIGPAQPLPPPAARPAQTPPPPAAQAEQPAPATQAPAAPPQPAPRTPSTAAVPRSNTGRTIAVLDFQVYGGVGIGAFLPKDLNQRLQQRTSAKVVSGPRLRPGLAKAGAAAKDCYGPQCAATIGRALDADYVVVGRVTYTEPERWVATTLLVDVASIKVIASQAADGKGVRTRQIAAAAERLAHGMAVLAPAVFDKNRPLAAAAASPRDRKRPPKPKRVQPPTDPNKLTLGLVYGSLIYIVIPAQSDDLEEKIESQGVSLGYQRRLASFLDTYLEFQYSEVTQVTVPELTLFYPRSTVDADGLVRGVMAGIGWPYVLNCCEFFIGGGAHWYRVDYRFDDPTFSGGQNTAWKITTEGIHLRASVDARIGQRCSTGAMFFGSELGDVDGNRIDRYEEFQSTQYFGVDDQFTRITPHLFSFTLRAGCRF